MTVDKRILSVAVLNCGYTAPRIQKARGQYHEIFASLLQPAVGRVTAKLPNVSNVELNVSGYDTREQEYPATLVGLDAIIISGSPNGAYQELEWIKTLLKFVFDVYYSHPAIKFYGSCFGHQILCQALLSSRGAIVEKDPAGWELGVCNVSIADKFAKRFAWLLPSKTLRLQALHGDHVIIPSEILPKDIEIIGSTPHCPVQGIYQEKRMLTFQGHPEFDQFIETECLKLVSKRDAWDEEFTADAFAAADAKDDAAVAADIIIAFLLDAEQ